MSLAYRNTKKHQAPAYILIGDGFDELEVIYFLHRFRQAGLPIKSVSLFNKLVFSRQGVGLKADYELADSPVDPESNCLVILPSGGRNGEMLRRDARVKTLLQRVQAGSGYIAVTDEKSHLATDIEQLFPRRPAIQPHHGQALEEFVEDLANRAAYAA